MGHHESGIGDDIADFERELHPLIRKWVSAKNEDIRDDTGSKIAKLYLDHLLPKTEEDRKRLEEVFTRVANSISQHQSTFYERFFRSLTRMLPQQRTLQESN